MIQIAACGSGVIALCIGVTGLMELAAGGSLEDALKAMAFTAASFGTWHVVGTALSVAQQAYHLTASAFFVLKTSVHGVVGGALSLAQGGSFIDGFVSNAVGAAAGLGSEGIFGAAGTGGSQGFFGRTAVAAIAGGTASELTGSKFANSALTAAFAQMWNAERLRFGPKMGPDLSLEGTMNRNCSCPRPPSIDWDLLVAQGMMSTQQIAALLGLVHGNTATLMRKTEVYYLVNRASLDIDKIGVTSFPGQRYSRVYLRTENVIYRTVATYTWRYPALLHENIALVSYYNLHGRLPRLNRSVH